MVANFLSKSSTNELYTLKKRTVYVNYFSIKKGGPIMQDLLIAHQMLIFEDFCIAKL